jgi:hypothetical protein
MQIRARHGSSNTPASKLLRHSVEHQRPTTNIINTTRQPCSTYELMRRGCSDIGQRCTAALFCHGCV